MALSGVGGVAALLLQKQKGRADRPHAAIAAAKAPSLRITNPATPRPAPQAAQCRFAGNYPDLQILFTTGYARNAIVHAGRLDAGVELLTKPFTHEALSSKIREVLDKPGANRALLIFPSADGRADASDLLGGLGFDTDVAGSAREALGKLRSAGGRFDFVLLSDALPVGNLSAVIAELHAVRNDLPIIVIHSADVRELQAQIAGKPCVGFVESKSDVTIIRVELEKLKVRCTDG